MSVDRPDEIVSWAEDPASLINEPENERKRGWPFGYLPPADQKNWLQRAVGRWIDYLAHGGSFREVYDLIDALETGDTSTLAVDQAPVGDLYGAIESSDDILAIDVDGKRVYWIDDTGTLHSALVEDIDVRESFDLTTIAGFDASEFVGLSSNGAKVAVAFTDSSGADQEGNSALFDVDDLTLDWSESVTATSTDVTIAALEIVGDSLLVTVDVAGSRQSQRIDLATETVISDFDSDTSAVILATNGQSILMNRSGNNVALHDLDFNEIWTLDVGASDVFAAMDRERCFISVSGNELHVVNASRVAPDAYIAFETPGEYQVISDAPFGAVEIDADRIYIDAYSTPDTWQGRRRLDPQTRAANWPPTGIVGDVFDTQPRAELLASDSRYVCIAGPAVIDSSATNAIAILDAQPRARTWRRLDPVDNNSWTRTLAAPI